MLLNPADIGILKRIPVNNLEAVNQDAVQLSRLSPPQETYEKRLFSQPQMGRPHDARPISDVRDQLKTLAILAILIIINTICLSMSHLHIPNSFSLELRATFQG